ncbi:hypothetical protein K502DRAFT_330795 [Neoconidiobolus thromboides FSU 785]|nr:hypothetical protein K502DRAFT_330795 [Neoconidiobolus thromboides FSU 785]
MKLLHQPRILTAILNSIKLQPNLITLRSAHNISLMKKELQNLTSDYHHLNSSIVYKEYDSILQQIAKLQLNYSPLNLRDMNILNLFYNRLLEDKRISGDKKRIEEILEIINVAKLLPFNFVLLIDNMLNSGFDYVDIAKTMEKGKHIVFYNKLLDKVVRKWIMEIKVNKEWKRDEMEMKSVLDLMKQHKKFDEKDLQLIEYSIRKNKELSKELELEYRYFLFLQKAKEFKLNWEEVYCFRDYPKYINKVYYNILEYYLYNNNIQVDIQLVFQLINSTIKIQEVKPSELNPAKYQVNYERIEAFENVILNPNHLNLIFLHCIKWNYFEELIELWEQYPGLINEQIVTNCCIALIRNKQLDKVEYLLKLAKIRGLNDGKIQINLLLELYNHQEYQMLLESFNTNLELLTEDKNINIEKSNEIEHKLYNDFNLVKLIQQIKDNEIIEIIEEMGIKNKNYKLTESLIMNQKYTFKRKQELLKKYLFYLPKFKITKEKLIMNLIDSCIEKKIGKEEFDITVRSLNLQMNNKMWLYFKLANEETVNINEVTAEDLESLFKFDRLEVIYQLIDNKQFLAELIQDVNKHSMEYNNSVVNNNNNNNNIEASKSIKYSNEQLKIIYYTFIKFNDKKRMIYLINQLPLNMSYFYLIQCFEILLPDVNVDKYLFQFNLLNLIDLLWESLESNNSKI